MQARNETSLLNGTCPNDRKHSDISTKMDDHSGRFELKCHNCDQTFTINSTKK